jgi:hypothetical protein
MITFGKESSMVNRHKKNRLRERNGVSIRSSAERCSGPRHKAAIVVLGLPEENWPGESPRNRTAEVV